MNKAKTTTTGEVAVRKMFSASYRLSACLYYIKLGYFEIVSLQIILAQHDLQEADMMLNHWGGFSIVIKDD